MEKENKQLKTKLKKQDALIKGLRRRVAKGTSKKEGRLAVRRTLLKKFSPAQVHMLMGNGKKAQSWSDTDIANALRKGTTDL